MAYIGKTPVIGNFQKCDSISVVNGQAAYTLQVGGTNVSPQSENHMLVSLNGILQAPTDSFTVSGSTLTFASNLITGDVIDFVMILGNVLDLGVPSDNTVTTAKIVDGAITSAKLGSGVGGKILQVVQATKQDTQDFALATGTLSDVTGLSASITPSSSSNKILVMFTVHIGQNSGGSANAYINIDRGGSNIFIGDASGSRTRGTSSVGIDLASTYTLKIATQTYLDSPSTTSATTYKLRAGGYNSRSFSINKTLIDDAEGNVATSTLTLMEVSA
jgi:hypothetical protein